VQQDHRRSITALQHGGRVAGQLQPSLGDGERSQQPPASVAVAADTPAALLHVALPAYRWFLVGMGCGHGWSSLA
jgi:hypothetical protein